MSKDSKYDDEKQSGSASETNKGLSQRMFERYDFDHNGYISLDEFQAMLRDHGIDLRGTALELAHRELDANGDHRISYEEFISWKRNSAFENLSLDDEKLEQRKRLAATFDQFDEDGDGVIDREEFRLLYLELDELGLVSCDQETLLERIDRNNNRLIEFNELCFFMENL
jgi:Ca2+-binding EF-hand superfamily protein